MVKTETRQAWARQILHKARAWGNEGHVGWKILGDVLTQQDMEKEIEECPSFADSVMHVAGLSKQLAFAYKTQRY
jgi:hypothetical protein